MARHRGNRPLMIYTSLIFVVAIAMVVIAFMGDKHLRDTQLQQIQQTAGISERASQLSEENRLLMELNQKLLTENEELIDAKDKLSEQNEKLLKECEQNEKLYEVYRTLNKSGKSKARKLLEGIYTEDLVDYQKDFYDSLVKKCD